MSDIQTIGMRTATEPTTAAEREEMTRIINNLLHDERGRYVDVDRAEFLRPEIRLVERLIHQVDCAEAMNGRLIAACIALHAALANVLGPTVTQESIDEARKAVRSAAEIIAKAEGRS